MPILDLSIDELLSTTRAVRKRLDLSRPVEADVLRECLELAGHVLGIPYDQVMQIGLIPVAYTRGTTFKPARRKPLESVLHWDHW